MKTGRHLLRDSRGSNLVEKLIVVALVALIALSGFRFFGNAAGDTAQAKGDCVAALESCGNGNGNSGVSGDLVPNRTDQIDNALKKDDGGDDGGGGGVFGWLGKQAKNFVKGGVLGSFGGNTGWAGFAAKMIVGAIPIVGQIADARDTIASVIGVIKDPTNPLSWTDLGASAIGWVPVVGDAAKESIRGGKEVMKAIPWITRTYSGGRQAARGEPED